MLNDCFLRYYHCRKSIGVRGFFGHPKKKKKNQVAFKIQKSPRREELAKKEKKQQKKNLIRLHSEFTYHQEMNIEQISRWIQLQ